MNISHEDASMPIAVIGMGCRFPGDATSPEKLWDVLAEGRSEWSEFPKDRINIDGFFHPSGDRQGSINFRGGHFLSSNVAAWDAPFFSITAQEAAAMDPQQRILLEVSYEALENAGIPIESLPGSATAVYCGSFVKDYEQICLRDPDDSPIYAATGNGIAIMSNRISWFYDLRGPSMTLDTGCSASLVGVHLACQSLRTGESKLAIAAGAGLILTPSTMMPMTALNFLSPDGKCFTFDERANGYGRGEGIGMVVLKPLEDALRDNDTIRAVIRGSGVNQDGRTPGITVPSKESQVDNMRAVYSMAGLDFQDTTYCEAHGTGTQVGDPAELGAIGEVFSSKKTSKNPLYVGSIKTNIGHLEGCAGIAGLIKGVLTLEKGLIPQNLWFENCNTKISLQDGRIKVPTELTPWPVEGLRRASINCFGFGGTNAHIILDDAYNYLLNRNLLGNHSTIADPAPATPTSEDSFVRLDDQTHLAQQKRLERKRLYVLSSHEQSGIARLADTYIQYLREHGECARADEILQDLVYTLGSRRSMLPWRSFAIASSIEELQKNLSLTITKPIRSSNNPRVAFVFNGQGAQWYKMGRELLAYDAFSLSLHEADMLLEDIGCEWSLMDELIQDEKSSRVNMPDLSQPLCTALQIALVDLMKTWKISPYAVVGHSSGEIAAAYCKGAISKLDACKLAYYRGQAAESLSAIAPNIKGRMMAISISAKEVEGHIKAIKTQHSTLDIACINSELSTTVSGDEDAILELNELLVSKGITAQLLAVTVAYHSGHMSLIKDSYLSSIKDVGLDESNTDCQMFSSVTGSELQDKDLTSSYWSTNLVSPVQFSDAMQSLMAASGRPDVFVEIGPHSTLRSPIMQILETQIKRGPKPTYLAILRRGMEANLTALDMAGQLWNRGYPIDLACVNDIDNSTSIDQPKALTDLPTYPWNHSKTYWHESHLSKAHRFRRFGRRDLLGSPTADSTTLEPRWRGFLRLSENPWMQDHQIQNSILYPAAGMAVMVLEAASQIKDESRALNGYELRNVNIVKPMIIPGSAHGLETALNLRFRRQDSADKQSDSAWYEFTITSYNTREEWEEHCNGLLRIKYADVNDNGLGFCHSNQQKLTYMRDYQQAQNVCTETLLPRQLYESLESVGMKYGPLFRNITNIRKSRDSACTTIRIPETRSSMQAKFEFPHIVHPATLDALFQTVFVAGKEPMLPAYIESLYVSSDIPREAGANLYGHSSAAKLGLREAVGTVIMSDQQWVEPKIILKGFKCVALGVSDNLSSTAFLANNQKLCAEVVWREFSDDGNLNDFDGSTEANTQIQTKIGNTIPPVLLIRPETPLQTVINFIDSLAKKLSEYGCEVEITTLAGGNFEDKICLSFLEIEKPFVSSWSKGEYERFKHLIKKAESCLWVTKGGQINAQNPLFGTIHGLLRTIRSEDSLKKLYTLDISSTLDASSDTFLSAVMSTFITAFGSNSAKEETEYAEKDGKIYVPRIILDEGLNATVERGISPIAPKLLEFHQANRSLTLDISVLGRLESLRFDDNAEHELPLEPYEVEVLVKAIGVNSVDAMTIMGQTSNATIGQDIAGTITRLGSSVEILRIGENVVCFTSNAYRTHVRTSHAMVKPIPPGLSFEQAASLPTSYATAYYSLVEIGHLKNEDSIFIHDATSNVGQAAIQISQWIGAKIFVSVVHGEKKDLLTKCYGLKDDQMFSIYEDDFVDGVTRMTEGKGVDVILTTAVGDSLSATWDCIGDYGRFISLCSSESLNSRSNIASKRHNIIFSSPDIGHLIKTKPTMAGGLLDSILELIACGSVREVEPLHVLDLSQIADAFREVYNSNHIGQVVLQIKDKSLVPIVPIDPHPIALDRNATYILVGGLGGLGRSLAKLLVENGARNIAFISRSGADTEEKAQLLNLLGSRGCLAKSYPCDICDKTHLALTLDQISREMSRIRGVIQAAAVVKDGIFDNLTYEDFVTVTKPKIQGSWNLHEILPQDLDFFIMLSSSAGVIGSRGQANYAAGNSFQDALSHYRRSYGLASVTLDLGMILGAGMVAENEQTLDMLRASGFFGIREEDFHTLVSSAITGFSQCEYRVPPQVIIGTGTGGLVKQNKVSDPYWYRDARFSIMRKIDVEVSDNTEISSSSVSALIANTSLVSEVTEIICTGLATLLSKTLSMPLEDLDVLKPANAYGVDSLVVVGIRNWILKETSVDVSIFEILSEISVEGLSAQIAEKCPLVGDEV